MLERVFAVALSLLRGEVCMSRRTESCRQLEEYQRSEPATGVFPAIFGTQKKKIKWITLIGGPAGRAGWRTVFPNEKRELSADWQAAQKTEGRASGLYKKAIRRAGEKGIPPARPFPQPSVMCSPLARPVVQPAGPPFCAARQPAENSCFSFGNTALQPARPSV